MGDENTEIDKDIKSTTNDCFYWLKICISLTVDRLKPLIRFLRTVSKASWNSLGRGFGRNSRHPPKQPRFELVKV